MRALDDLAGCASIMAALKILAADENRGEVYGVFTRAEEVGLIGARLLAENGTLPMGHPGGIPGGQQGITGRSPRRGAP